MRILKVFEKLFEIYVSIVILIDIFEHLVSLLPAHWRFCLSPEFIEANDVVSIDIKDIKGIFKLFLSWRLFFFPFCSLKYEFKLFKIDLAILIDIKLFKYWIWIIISVSKYLAYINVNF